MTRGTKNLLAFIGAVVAAFLIWYFFFHSKKDASTTNTTATGTGGTGGVVPVGTTVNTEPSGTSTGGAVVVSITELTQSLLTGTPFLSNSRILTGVVAPVYSNMLENVLSGDGSTGQRVIFDPNSGTNISYYDGFVNDSTHGAYTTPTMAKSISVDNLNHGIKLKNIIWIVTDKLPSILGATGQAYPAIGTFERLYAVQYYTDGTEKKFDFPVSGYAIWVFVPEQNIKKQFKYISIPDTQTALNTSTL